VRGFECQQFLFGLFQFGFFFSQVVAHFENVIDVLGLYDFFVFFYLSFYTACVATAWATVGYVKPNDASYEVKAQSKESIPAQMSAASKAKAPEPASLALFASGLFGMIMSFLRKTYALAKRIFDIVGAVIGLILFSPLILFTAILIRLTSKGPILYSQVRVGKDGQLFQIYKFRSMRVDAEKHSGPVWATKNDNRITPVGRFLRRSRIDELPQFINVLRGDMSIVGPRPERPMFVEQFTEKISDYSKRLDVKPGITGLAQTHHRYDETIQDVKKKVKYDVLYVKKMCFWADLSIILKTFRVVLTGFGAK
jgi:exopolysaccharide biosynthesis polyprenyl glycosylphosphotransferase